MLWSFPKKKKRSDVVIVKAWNTAPRDRLPKNCRISFFFLFLLINFVIITHVDYVSFVFFFLSNPNSFNNPPPPSSFFFDNRHSIENLVQIKIVVTIILTNYQLSIQNKHKYTTSECDSMVSVGTKAQICILGLGPYLMIWIYLRWSKWLEMPQNRESRKENVEEYSPRRLSFSDRMNVSQAST